MLDILTIKASIIFYLLKLPKAIHAQVLLDSGNSSDTCVCDSNLCASCNIFIVCSSTTTETTFSNSCELQGSNSCKSRCPFKPSEGILYLQSKCVSSSSNQNCSLLYSCGNSSPSTYLPCQGNSDSAKSSSESGCLYCFKAPSIEISVPKLHEPINSQTMQSSTAGMAQSFAPTASSESPTPPLDRNPASIANSDTNSGPIISTILFSALIPSAVIFLAIIIRLCKIRRAARRRSILPSQDTLRDFEGDLDELKSSEKITTTNLAGNLLLLSKAASEKTIIEPEGDLNQTFHDIDMLKDNENIPVMNNVYVPNGRLRPVNVSANDPKSTKLRHHEFQIPELSIEKNRRKYINSSKVTYTGFFTRLANSDREAAEANALQLDNDLIDAPPLIYQKPDHIMVPKKFKNFEKRQSAGSVKFNLDEIVIIDESSQH